MTSEPSECAAMVSSRVFVRSTSHRKYAVSVFVISTVARFVRSEMLEVFGQDYVTLAKAKGLISEIVTNGTMIDIASGAPRVVDEIETGRIYLDGNVLIGAMDGVVRDRIRMALNGHATVSVIVDENDEVLPDAWVETMGLAAQGRAGVPLADRIESELADYLDRVDDATVMDDKKLDEGVRRITRQVAMEEVGKKPEVKVIISRLAAD